jgi:lipid II:glycine glycyltransferase (peptidoglycan interpeptide bridge formation enzyme)
MVSAEIIEIVKKDFRQTPQFARFIESKGFKTKTLKNGSIFHEFSLGPISIIKSFRPTLDEQSLTEVQEIANQKSNLICKIAPNFEFEQFLSLKQNYKIVNSVMSPTKTLIRDLTQDIDSIFSSFSESTKYKINRSFREKDRIEIIQNPTNVDINKFYDNLEDRQKFKKFETLSRKEVRFISNSFWNDSYLISAYSKDNKLIVSNLYFKFGEKVVYFAGSLNSENSKSKAGFQLILEAFKFFKNLGVKVYDFEGLSDERDPYNAMHWGNGFTEFKLKFAKEEIYYPKTIIKYNNFVIRQMTKLFQL